MRPPSSVSLGIDPRARVAQAAELMRRADAALYADKATG
jgi:PleD family two-component response regulator